MILSVSSPSTRLGEVRTPNHKRSKKQELEETPKKCHHPQCHHSPLDSAKYANPIKNEAKTRNRRNP